MYSLIKFQCFKFSVAVRSSQFSSTMFNKVLKFASWLLGEQKNQIQVQGQKPRTIVFASLK